MRQKATVKPSCPGCRPRSTRVFDEGSRSTVTNLPSQVTDSSAFADKLYAKQHAKQPNRSDREAGPKVEGEQYPDNAARQDPAPIWEGSYRQCKNNLGNALHHQEHNQKKREDEKSLAGVA